MSAEMRGLVFTKVIFSSVINAVTKKFEVGGWANGGVAFDVVWLGENAVMSTGPGGQSIVNVIGNSSIKMTIRLLDNAKTTKALDNIIVAWALGIPNLVDVFVKCQDGRTLSATGGIFKVDGKSLVGALGDGEVGAKEYELEFSSSAFVPETGQYK